jgi:hypothetical protein
VTVKVSVADWRVTRLPRRGLTFVGEADVKVEKISRKVKKRERREDVVGDFLISGMRFIFGVIYVLGVDKSLFVSERYY